MTICRPPTTDAELELFKTVGDLLNEQWGESAKERCTQVRRPYQCVQLLAPYDEIQLPSQADFRQVQCQDLSENGFSFMSYRRPESRFVIVALGAVPFLFFVAEIVHIESVTVPSEYEFKIGCRFTNRVSAPEGKRVTDRPDSRLQSADSATAPVIRN